MRHCNYLILRKRLILLYWVRIPNQYRRSEWQHYLPLPYPCLLGLRIQLILLLVQIIQIKSTLPSVCTSSLHNIVMEWSSLFFRFFIFNFINILESFINTKFVYDGIYKSKRRLRVHNFIVIGVDKYFHNFCKADIFSFNKIVLERPGGYP